MLVTPGCAGMLGRRAAVETQLFFGLGRPDGGVVSEAEWSAFLADVVTPRFADGLTVLAAEGQYRDDGVVVHERTRVLVLVHGDDRTADESIAAIVDEYKRRFAQRAVLRVDLPTRDLVSGR